MSRVAALLACALAALLALAAPAGADVFSSISLVSADPFEQATYAHDPAISGNGRYVAFDGEFGGLSGVFRAELVSNAGGHLYTAAIEPVAVGAPGTPAGSAELPSISKTGQYVSFTTLAALAPENDTNVAPDVYVRNMDVPESQPCAEETVLQPLQPCAFTLVSAVSGSTQGLSYEFSGALADEAERYGSEAAGRSAITADGEQVVFVTTAASNLAGAGTPSLQVAVRNLRSGVTELVSVEYDPATGAPAIDPETGQPRPVATQREGGFSGAVYTQGGPPAFRAEEPYTLTAGVGASISADGSTVAWMGQNVAEQARTLPDEKLYPLYSEPLWRRIGDGPQTPTLRVTGGSDPANPACVASGETELPPVASASDPCQGPFNTQVVPQTGVWGGTRGDVVPRLSAEGWKVAFIATAPLVSLGQDFGVDPASRHSDLYVANMHEGLTRDQALTQLTELASGDESAFATNAMIIDFGISPDGNQIAFTTKRTVFPLGSPAYVSAPQARPGLLELFDVDLEDDTLTRVTTGYEGGASEHPLASLVQGQEDQYLQEEDGALSPSFSTGGETLVFASTASNLVYGDGNTPSPKDTQFDGSDAFAVQRELFGATPTPEAISEAPANPTLEPSWSLGLTAASQSNGTVTLYVETPVTGALQVRASGQIVVHSTRLVRVAHSSKRKRVAKTSRVSKQVAAANAQADGAEGTTAVTLTLSPAYRALAARSGGFAATVQVTFTAPGAAPLRKSIEVAFVRKPAKAASATTARKRKRAKAGAGR